MKDQAKTKKQLIAELEELRRRTTESERNPRESQRTHTTLRRLQRIVEQSSDGIAIADMDGTIEFVNVAWARMHGFSETEIPGLFGKHLRIFHSDDQLEEDVLPFMAILRKQGAHEGEVGHVRKDGTTFPTWMTVTVLRDEQDSELGFVGTARDVTGQKRAQEVLRSSEERLRLMFESAPIAKAATDLTGQFCAVNRAFCELVGYTADELLRIRFTDITHPDDVEDSLALMQRILKGETTDAHLHKRYLRKDGTVIEGVVHVGVIRDATGKPRQLLAQVEDITKRTRAERALRDSEQRYRALVELSRGLICLHELDGTILSINPAAARSLGYEPGHGAGRNLAEFLAPDVRAQFTEYLKRIERTGTDEGVMRIVTRTGEERIWAYHNTLHEERGQSPYVLGHAIDITEVKRAELAARQSQARYRALVEHATYGIYQSTLEGRFLEVNPALVTMLGYESEQELIAVDMARDIYADPAERARLVGRFKDSERFERLEVEWRQKDRTPVMVRLSGRPVHNDEGMLEYFEVIVEDITEQRKLEAEVRQAQKMEAVGQLTGGIAHDFNNILTIMMANAQLMDDVLPPNSEDARSELAELRAAGRRGTAMVKKLLSFSRREMLRLKLTDLTTLVEDLSTPIRRLISDSIDTRILGETPSPYVSVDPGAVERILVNLVTNARDAMPDGGLIRIETRRAWLDEEHHAHYGWGEPGDYMCLSVSDTGVGMHEQTREKVFEPFFTTKSPGEGTGLGMAMVFGLVKQQHGYVEVQSQPGEGTTVRVYFPMVREKPRADTAEAQTTLLRGGSEVILLVDDEAPIRRAAQRVLERHGYSVLQAADGEEGFRTFREHKSEISLVVADMVMPKMTGPDLYNAVRNEGDCARFIFTSGYASRDLRSSVGMDPATPFLPKPWTVTELLMRVREALDQPQESPAGK